MSFKVKSTFWMRKSFGAWIRVEVKENCVKQVHSKISPMRGGPHSNEKGKLEPMLFLERECYPSKPSGWPQQNSITLKHKSSLSLPEIASCWILNCMLRLGFSSGLGAPDCKFTSPLRLGSFCGVIFPTSHVSTLKRHEKTNNLNHLIKTNVQRHHKLL